MMEEHQPPARAAEPAAPARDAGDPLDDPRALQILSTEHWSLLATRSLAYNEAFSRAGMFLSFLSATLIVIGFLLSSATFSAVVIPVVALLLLADLFIGLATLGRLLGASAEELHSVRGMNRIRHAYRDMVPGLELYFVSGFHDDARGVLTTYGPIGESRSLLRNVLHGVTTTVGMVGTIDAFILGALVSVVAIGFGIETRVVIGLGVAGFVVTFGVLSARGMRAAMRGQARAKAIFPSPD
jgi:hypothetical protein